jgi:hypothetical protein
MVWRTFRVMFTSCGGGGGFVHMVLYMDGRFVRKIWDENF